MRRGGTEEPMERSPMFLYVCKVPISVTALAVFFFIGISFFVSGIVFTGIAYGGTDDFEDMQESNIAFMGILGPVLVVVGSVLAAVCAVGICMARKGYVKSPVHTDIGIPSAPPPELRTQERMVIRDIFANPEEPQTRGGAPERHYEVAEIQRTVDRSGNRFFISEPLETIRPPRPSRRYKRQSTPPEKNEIPPSYEEVMVESVLSARNN